MSTTRYVDSIKGEIETFNASMRDVTNGDSIVRDFRGDTVEKALEHFAPYLDFVISYPGWILERFQEVEDRLFCYVRIDLQQPTLDSLEFFYPHPVEVSILVCDDYGFATCPGATDAFDAFLSDKPETIMALPGSGFLMKGRATAEPGLYFEPRERSSSTC